MAEILHSITCFLNQLQAQTCHQIELDTKINIKNIQDTKQRKIHDSHFNINIIDMIQLCSHYKATRHSLSMTYLSKCTWQYSSTYIQFIATLFTYFTCYNKQLWTTSWKVMNTHNMASFISDTWYISQWWHRKAHLAKLAQCSWIKVLLYR